MYSEHAMGIIQKYLKQRVDGGNGDVSRVHTEIIKSGDKEG